jgi:hypothetical protein
MCLVISEDKDERFWRGVYEHPSVKPHVSFGLDVDLADLLGNEWVTPLRAEHGGFFFVRLDGLGRVHELHTLFTPEGWGREVLQALKEAVELMFQRGAQIITTYDVEGNWRSKPPKTFRFEPAGDFAATHLGPRLRTWVLTRNAWEASPARQRMATCL